MCCHPSSPFLHLFHHCYEAQNLRCLRWNNANKGSPWDVIHVEESPRVFPTLLIVGLALGSRLSHIRRPYHSSPLLTDLLNFTQALEHQPSPFHQIPLSPGLVSVNSLQLQKHHSETINITQYLNVKNTVSSNSRIWYQGDG